MGCVNNGRAVDVKKARCGKCKVGKLVLKMKSFQLHSLTMNLENVKHLNLYLQYGAEKLQGLGLWRFAEEPELFEFEIPIHRCCLEYRRALTVSIKNSQTNNSAFGFLELTQFIEMEGIGEDRLCYLNYQRSPAGKIKFDVNFQEVNDYEEFVFQVYEAGVRVKQECESLRVRITIGEEVLQIQGPSKERKDIKWHHQNVEARVPLNIVTEGKVELLCVKQDNNLEYIGQIAFTLAPFKDPTNIVNQINEKVTIQDFFERESTDGKKYQTGHILMFIVKKQSSGLLYDEPLSPDIRHKKTIRRRHILEQSQTSSRLRKYTFKDEPVVTSQRIRLDNDETEDDTANYNRRNEVVSMPPLEIYKIIRKKSLRKPQFKAY